MKVRTFKKKEKIQNFDLMIDEICDFDIVYKKFTRMYKLVKTLVAQTSHIYNATANSIKGSNSLREYISNIKSQYTYYTPIIENLEKTTMFNKEEKTDVETHYKAFCKSSLTDVMMHAYTSLLLHDVENDDWLTMSKTEITPFKGCDIGLFSLYKVSKEEVIKRIRLLKPALVEYYELYLLPNFDMDRSIDGICDYLMDLHKTNKVKCDLIPGYIKKVHGSGLINMNELNELYIECENRNMFVIELFEKFFKTDKEDIVIDARTSSQIKGLLAYLQNAKGSEAIQGTLGIGQALLGKADKK